MPIYWIVLGPMNPQSLKHTKMESILMKFEYALWNYHHGM